jgi:hypothetical protein
MRGLGIMKTLLAALALGTTMAIPAEARDFAPSERPAAETDVERLVMLLLPEDAIMRLAARAFDAGMESEIETNASAKAVYAANPGLKEAIAARLRPEMTAIMKEGLPGLRKELAALITSDLTASEIADTLTFFVSPTGQKLRSQVYETMGENPMQSEAEMQQAAMAAVMAKMTADDYPALMAFGASPAAKKMQTVNPRISAVSQEWAKRVVAANDARMKAIAAEVTRDFLAKKKS